MKDPHVSKNVNWNKDRYYEMNLNILYFINESFYNIF